MAVVRKGTIRNTRTAAYATTLKTEVDTMTFNDWCPDEEILTSAPIPNVRHRLEHHNPKPE